MKKKVDPNYHSGKTTGYHLVNGKYHVAPTYIDRFDKLQHAAKGIDMMLKIVTSHASEDLESIAKVRAGLWKEIYDDIGLDEGTMWVYRNGVISKRIDAKKK